MYSFFTGKIRASKCAVKLFNDDPIRWFDWKESKIMAMRVRETMIKERAEFMNLQNVSL